MDRSGSPLPAVILAGGLATRLRPLTERIPKALVEVAGKPFLEHQLALLRSRGISHAVLCVGYLGEMIAARYGDGSHLGVQLRYSYDGPELLGTAGAIRRALPLLGESFFVLYGDSYLTCDYAAAAEAFRRRGRRGLMTVYRNDGRFDASNVEYAGGEILKYDKRARTSEMRYIDYGLGVFRRSVFEEIPEGTARDLAAIYQDLLLDGDLAAYESTERFYEIGSPEGLAETAEYLARIESQRTAH